MRVPYNRRYGNLRHQLDGLVARDVTDPKLVLGRPAMGSAPVKSDLDEAAIVPLSRYTLPRPPDLKLIKFLAPDERVLDTGRVRPALRMFARHCAAQAALETKVMISSGFFTETVVKITRIERDKLPRGERREWRNSSNSRKM